MRSLLAFILLYFSTISTLQAQPLNGPGSAALDPLFQKVLKQPNDLQTNLLFARRAFELGDFEASAATLERLLIANPERPIIRIELAALYFRLGAAERAGAYLLQALESTGLPAGARKKGEDLLADIRAAERKGSVFASIGLSVIHQSNAVARPEIDDLLEIEEQRSNSRDDYAPLVIAGETYPDLTPEADATTQGYTVFGYSRELAGFTSRLISTQFTHFSSRQSDDELNTLAISSNEFNLNASLPFEGDRFSYLMQPYLSIGQTDTDEINKFVRTMGLGVNGIVRVNDRRRITLSASITNQEYARKNKEGLLTDNQNKDGIRGGLSAGFSQSFGRNGTLSGQFAHSITDAEADWESNSQSTVSFSYGRPLGKNYLSGLANLKTTERDGISPDVILQQIREDEDLSVNLTIQRRFLGVNLKLTAAYFKRDSNFANYNYANESVTLSISRTFQ